MIRRCFRRLSFVVALVAAVVVLGTGVPMSAGAQETVEPEPGGMDVQTFRPAVGPGGLLEVEGADTGAHLRPYGSLFFDMFSDPVALRYDDGRRESVVDHRLDAHLLVGIGAMDRFQFELGMPVTLLNQGEYLGESIGGFGPGDLEARTKATIVSSREAPVGLGAALDVSLPTGRIEEYRGAGSATATPQLIGDTRFETPLAPVVVAANVGARLRETEAVHNLEIGSGLTYGAGAEVKLAPDRWSVGLDVFGTVGLGEVRRETSPMEFLLGTTYRVTDTLEATVGGGAGIVGGIGSPEWRGMAGLTYSPNVTADRPAPSTSTEPQCPPEPEGFDGPYDEEGCPIVAETETGCEGLDADWEGAVDEQGCPLLDADGDGLLDRNDECPLEPRQFVDGGGDDGCPDFDIDGDGVSNVEDQCLREAGLRVYDGCPPPEGEAVAERVEDEEISLEERVHFEYDKAIIEEASYAALEEVAMVIRNHSDVLLVEIAGHTDDRGEDDYNRRLSEERAKAVREFLIERGNLNPARLSAEGYGAREPIVDEDSEVARARNRRVEFRIVETGEEGEAETLDEESRDE